MQDEQENSVSWLEKIFSMRSALRGVTLLIAAGLLYTACGALIKHENAWDAGVAINSLNALLILFAFSHGVSPSEVSEFHARTTARGIMRGLARLTVVGGVLIGQFCAWWQHDVSGAFLATGVAGVSIWIFAASYAIYANTAKTDRIAAKRPIFRLGTGDQTIIEMGMAVILGFVALGLSIVSKDAMLCLGALAAAMFTIFLLAILSMGYRSVIDKDYDRG